MCQGFKEGRQEWGFSQPPQPLSPSRAGRGQEWEGHAFGSSADQQCWQELLLFKTQFFTKAYFQKPPRSTSPCLLFSTFCSSQLLWAKRFAKLIAAAGPARKNVLFSSCCRKVLPTFLFLMLSDASHFVCFVFWCLWYRHGLFNVVLHALPRRNPKYLIPFHAMLHKCLSWAAFRALLVHRRGISFSRALLPNASPHPPRGVSDPSSLLLATAVNTVICILIMPCNKGFEIGELVFSIFILPQWPKQRFKYCYSFK